MASDAILAYQQAQEVWCKINRVVAGTTFKAVRRFDVNESGARVTASEKKFVHINKTIFRINYVDSRGVVARRTNDGVAWVFPFFAIELLK